jgi:sigma-B regulation protein RsbU (phosphoserine phosphatase)
MNDFATSSQLIAPSVNDCRILIIDDNEFNRTLLQACFESSGIATLDFAVNGLEGLAKVASFEPDLVVLDIMMPEMDGYEFLRRLRSDEKHKDLPVLVQTALSSAEDRKQVFAVGATDLVTKPINRPELLARARIHLENRLLVGSLQAYRARIQDELEMAKKMQEALLPSEETIAAIAKKYGIRLEAYFETSSEMGGDFWGVREIDDNNLAIFIVDFSGHGVTAALNTFRLHTLMEQKLPDLEDPASYFAEMNSALVRLIPRGQFATMLFAVIDIANDSITYTAAASPNPIAGLTSETAPAIHDGSGVPLGIAKGMKYANRKIPFPKGSYLFLYSDALSETLDKEGKCLDELGVLDLVTESLSLHHGEATLNSILAPFNARMTRPLPDDLTAIWLVR